MNREKKYFSIIEMMVVVTIILLLIVLSAYFYKSVQRSTMIKNQRLEFENIRIAIQSYKVGFNKTTPGYSKHVNVYDLIYKHGLLSEKRVLLINGKDETKADEKIMSYFNTPIEVYVTKQKLGASTADIETKLKKISGFEYLTGKYEFYFGREHEKDGEESSAPPKGTPYGLIGTGGNDEANQYSYKFVYYEEENEKGPKHEYYLK